MKDISVHGWLVVLWLILASVYIVYYGYVFYFASCETVRANWFLVDNPARCITLDAR